MTSEKRTGDEVLATETGSPTEDLPRDILAPGQVLGDRYEVRSLLGRGGMGEVWQAFDLKLRVEVALKALRADWLQSERRHEMLRREVRAAREVVSPNVCRIFDLIEVEDRELVSMEYVDGATLLDVLAEHGPMELTQAQDVASQFLAGLEAIHAAGLVHRDVKPENIMLTRSGRVVVMDFGLARQATEGGGAVSGTPAYMSPEQASGDDLDARADVYAAGVVLAEMVSGEGVKDRESRHSLWEGVRSEPPKVPDSPWAAVIRRAVAKDREQRPRSAHTLIRELEEVTLRVAGAEDLTPYPGLASFTESDAEYFFGREAEVERFWARLEGPRLLAVIGPSGAGKSSFIRAGVLPAAPAGWASLVCTPGTAAVASLARSMAREMAGDADLVERLLAFDDPDVAVEVVGAWRAKYEQALLVVDQFEELFTLNPPDAQERLAGLLARLVVEADVCVVLSLRDDFLMRCRDHEALQPVFSELTALPPLGGSALRRALVQPAARCGYRFEDDGLVEAMRAEVEGERGALPLLAFAAAQLWERRDREGGLLTREAHEAIGGVGGALARHAEHTIDRIGSERLPLVRELFRNLITAEGTRAVRDTNELLSVFGEAERESAAEVLRELVDARLLTTYEIHDDEREPTRRVEIIHESLLANWPRLVRWQTQDADAAQLRDQLRQAARTWDEHERSDDLLWTGSVYREYALWRERYPGGLSDIEEEFARAMTAYARRRTRRRRLAIAAVVVVATATAAVFAGLWRRSELQTRRAEGARLLAIAQLELEGDHTAALAWATASLELADTPEARRFVVEASWRGPMRSEVELGPGQPDLRTLQFNPAGFVFSPDGRYLVGHSAGTSEMVVWSQDGGEPRVVGGPLATGPSRSVAFVETGTGEPVLVQLGTGASYRLWSVPEFEPLAEVDVSLPGEDLTEGWFHSSPDKLFRSAMVDGNAFLTSCPLDGGAPTAYGPLAREEWAWWGVSCSGSSILYIPEGLREIRRRPLDHLDDSTEDEMVARFAAGAQKFWCIPDAVFTVEDGTGVSRWSLGADPPHLLQVFRGPQEIEELDADGTVLVEWRHTGMHIWDLTGPPDALPTVIHWPGDLEPLGTELSPDGDWFVAMAANKLLLWPLAGPLPRVFQTPHTAQLEALAFAGDGSRLFSAPFFGQDRNVYLWPLSAEDGEIGRVVWDRGARGLAADPSGGRLLLARWSWGVWQLDIADDRSREVWPEGTGLIWSAVAFSPDGRRAVAAALSSRNQHDHGFAPENMQMRVWDTATWEERVFALHKGPQTSEGEGGVINLQFTSDGRLLTSGAGGVRLWDLETGESEWLLTSDRSLGMSADRDGRFLLTAEPETGSPRFLASNLTLFDRTTGASRPITSHGEHVWPFALDPTGTIVVTGVQGESLLQVGSADGSQPHLLYGHENDVSEIAISPDSRWIAAGDENGKILLWPMPDVTRPPLHTLPRDELINRLKTFTNLRVVRDEDSADDWKVEASEFQGWKRTPRW